MNVAPILLLGFNRVDSMTAQIEALRVARPTRLYIAVDGPRVEKSGEAEKCRAVQGCVKLIDWPCEIKTLFREKNLGCKYAVSSAITWFFENEEMGIILEDDCRPTLTFLRFATEMLIKYKDDERIGAVDGFNHFNLQSDNNVSYHFSSHMNVWGWASWRRVWKDYDADFAFCGNEREIDSYIDSCNFTPYMKWLYKKFVADVKQGLSSWAIPFSILFLVRKWLVIVPSVSLVANVGLADARATHTGGYVYWGKYWSRSWSLDFPLVHPKEIIPDEMADRLRERMEGAIFPRGLTWIGAKFPCLCGPMTFIGTVAEKVVPFLFRW